MILVTGGAGFIGSNIVAALAGDGARVAVCDAFGSDDKWRNLAKHDLADLVAPADLTGLGGWLDRHGAGVTAVVHMGAVSSTTERDVDLIVASNFRLSVDLWRFCVERHVPFVYASSAATYGDGAQGFADDGSRAYLATLRPLNPYGWSKHQFDRWVARAAADGAKAPPSWAGLKFFNVYGPNEYHKGDMMSVAVKAHASIMRGEPVRLFKSHNPDYADGGQLRDFVYVDDCVSIVRWLLDTASVQEGVQGLFNVGSGTARSFADLANAVYAALGREPDIEYIDMPEAIRDRYQYFTEAPMDRIRQAGFNQPATRLEDGVRAYVQTYLAADDPYR
jgi:ADP-L-glycero-D-manno-heptose 6-epimerase